MAVVEGGTGGVEACDVKGIGGMWDGGCWQLCCLLRRLTAWLQ